MFVTMSDWIAYMLLIGFIMAIGEIIVIFIIHLKTPAFKFLGASMKGQGMLINPKTNRSLEFISIKKQLGKLAETKRGFFYTKPADFYVEEKMKIPMAVTYSNYVVTFNPMEAKSTELLNEVGISNYDELQKFVDESVNSDKKGIKFMLGTVPNLFRRHQKEDVAEKKKDVRELAISGETISVEQVAQYYPSQWKSNDIESMLDHREAAKDKQNMKRRDHNSWIMYISVLFIAAAIAVVILLTITGHQSSPIDVQEIANAVSNRIATNPQAGGTIA